MRRFAGRFSALSRTDAGYGVVLCLLVLAAYLPAILYRVTANPIFSTSGLQSSYQPGRTPGYPWIDPNAGFTVQALGGYSAHQWLHGHIPWWDSYMGVGVPLAAEMQPASLFLPFVLLLHFSNGVVFLKIVLQMIAGLATFALLRQLGLGRFAAFCGAVFYALSGTFAWFADSPILPTPFLPLFLFGIERAFAKAGQKRHGGWIWIAVALAYSIFAGFPETAYLDGLLVLAWGVYRLSVSPRDARWAFARKIALGGIVGLLIAAPLIISFLEYQSLSAIRHNGWSHIALPKFSLAAFLMPYIFGPLHAFELADTSGQLAYGVGATGGYFGLTLLFLSITALFSGRRLRGLRILLGIWIVVFAARSLGVTFAENLLKFIPPLDYVGVFHYSEPTWEMCGAVLTALALDDWRKGIKRWPVLVGAAASLVITAAALGLSSGLIAQLFQHAFHYSKWFRGSLIWASLIIAGVAALLFRRPSRITARILAALVVVDAAVLFAIPELAGMRRPKLDLGAVNFLRQHLGLERMYTFAPLEPNYGSYFRVASINHNAVPVPAEWVRYIQQSLDSPIDPHLFIGYAPGPLTAREDAFRTHISGFEATGVKYVVTPPGENPFAAHAAVTQPEGANIAVPLKGGEQISGTIPPVQFPKISAIGVAIGTYVGSARGSLSAEVCAGAVCSSGSASLLNAADNQTFYIPVNPPVAVGRGTAIRYRFTHIPDSAEPRGHDVAIWIWPEQQGLAPIQVPGNRTMQYSPQLTVIENSLAQATRPVYRGAVADIYKLPHPAPYFEAQGGVCDLSPQSRESVRASCKAPAVLIRRELFYPGWRAYVNGKPAHIRADSIFEAIDLPAGESRISFAYSPTHIGWAYAAMITGLVAICVQLIVGRTARHAKDRTPNELVAADYRRH
jgi:hypothetical protein